MSNSNYVLYEYDKNLELILNTGFDIDGDRTGVGTKCLFGLNTKIDISKRIPILTKRKVVYQSIIKEFLWYVSGSNNANDLEKMGSKIWTPWRNKTFETKHNLGDGNLGYIYGFNLIHYGASIYDSNPKGFNQLDFVINTLRNNPKSRQAVFSFYRPDTNNQAILPACHAMYHFIIRPDENNNLTILDCSLFQRSADFPIGVGAGNLFIVSLFTYTIAQQLNLTPGYIYHSASHCHVYHNALESTTEYCNRDECPNSPILHLNYKPSIYDYTIDDFIVEDYNPLPAIKFPIAI